MELDDAELNAAYDLYEQEDDALLNHVYDQYEEDQAYYQAVEDRHQQNLDTRLTTWYKCGICKRQYKNPEEEIKCCQKIYELRKYVCRRCGRRFATKVDADMHCQVETRGYPCHCCERRFTRKAYQKKHLAKCFMRDDYIKEHGTVNPAWEFE